MYAFMSESKLSVEKITQRTISPASIASARWNLPRQLVRE